MRITNFDKLFDYSRYAKNKIAISLLHDHCFRQPGQTSLQKDLQGRGGIAVPLEQTQAPAELWSIKLDGVDQKHPQIRNDFDQEPEGRWLQPTQLQELSAHFVPHEWP